MLERELAIQVAKEVIETEHYDILSGVVKAKKRPNWPCRSVDYTEAGQLAFVAIWRMVRPHLRRISSLGGSTTQFYRVFKREAHFFAEAHEIGFRLRLKHSIAGQLRRR